MITTYSPFTEEVSDGFTVDANVGSTPVSVVEGSAVATCAVFTNCATECIIADVNDTGVKDPTFNVRVVTTDDFTNVASLNGVTLSTGVLWPTKNK